MHIFKTSLETYNSVIKNKKHAFKNKPKDLNPGDIIIISKNKKGMKFNEKQISHYAILKNIRETNDIEIESLWPDNPNRWKYIIEFSDVIELPKPFNLAEVLEGDSYKHYDAIMTHGKFTVEDESLIRKYIKINDNKIIPEELDLNDVSTIYEGSKKTITVNSYERDQKARELCIARFGYKCLICNFKFTEKYGEIGKDFIHVHHKKALNRIGREYIVDPFKDLIPVCPNCHAMLHKTNPPMSPEALKSLIKEINSK